MKQKFSEIARARIERNCTVDTAKGLGIVLVILGHLVTYGGG